MKISEELAREEADALEKSGLGGSAHLVRMLLEERDELLRELELARGQAYERQEALESADGLLRSYKDRTKKLEQVAFAARESLSDHDVRLEDAFRVLDGSA